jgi:glycosyltransferase involved in cell wall biosynthesis
MKRLAFLCPRYLWAGGGSVLYTRCLADELAGKGHEVTIIADETDTRSDPGALGEAACPVLTFPRDPRPEARAKSAISIEEKRGGYRLGRWLFRSGRTRLMARGPCCPELENPDNFREFDAVILMNSGSSAWTLHLAELLPRLSPGTWTAAFPFAHPHEEVSRYPVLKRLHEGYHAICTLTDFEQTFFAGRGWAQGDMHTMLAGSYPYPGEVDPLAFRQRHHIPPDAPLVLFLGRKIYNKGVTHVVEAMEQVWAEEPEARLALLGFSHNRPEWIQEYLDRSQFDVERLVIQADDVDTLEREEALAACSLLAVPSISDSFGMVYLDAWRHHKPVIACSESCCETFIDHGETGLLVAFDSVDALGREMVALLADPEAAARIGARGHVAWRERFQWHQVADRFETLLG